MLILVSKIKNNMNRGLIIFMISTITVGTVVGGSKNVHCGIPAADLEQSRDVTDSLSGKCFKNHCSCVDGFGCNNCGARMLLDEAGEYTTIRTMLQDPTKSVDICSVEWGGGYCTEDEECHDKGLCIENKCVCYHNWLCPYCELGLNEDILIGASCGDYVHGGGQCREDSDCGNNVIHDMLINAQGVCLLHKCMCGSGYVCSHCSLPAIDVIGGLSECPCDKVNCGKHGVCDGGLCICEAGYKGQYCNINICDSLDCGEHGVCSLAMGGVCVCDEGFTGKLCDTQPRGGAPCEKSTDCGSGVGGICNPTTKQCECYKGWTCPSCNKVGSECNRAAMIHGGASCSKNADCGNFGPDFDYPEKTGGKCEGGMCICFEGYTCPHCNTPGDPESVVKGDLKCIDGDVRGILKITVLCLTTALLFYLM